MPGTHTIPVKESTGTNHYVVVDEAIGLVSLVQRGVLELHAWGCTEADIERPDRLVFDLDPGPGVAWRELVSAAETVRDRLKDLKLKSLAKTSGGKGLHVVVPLTPSAKWDAAKEFAHAFADEMARDEPAKHVSTMSKAKRSGKIFIDYLRNGRGATSVASYSTRARSGAPVSLPLSWDELKIMRRPPSYSLGEAITRSRSDPWKAEVTIRTSQRLPDISR